MRRLGLLVGPAIVAATVAISWIPFASMPVDGGSDPLGLYLGSTSILLMAWSFLLALRLSPVETLFGGLDRGYWWHRWIGVAAIALMWLHIQQSNEVRGVAGASAELAEVGTSFAGFGEIVLYVLVGLSIVRFVPYQWWRLTHKLIGIPFIFAGFHFITAEKPFANLSPWGVWFGAIVLVGVLAWVGRVAVRDAMRPGIPYFVVGVHRDETVTDVTLRPAGAKRVRRRAGQFAFVKFQVPGLAEPHAFSVATAPDSDDLRFVMRVRGDWTSELHSAVEVGQSVVVEGPYGRLRLFPRRPRRTVWFAGGLGITPFLSGLDGSGDVVPEIVYSATDEATAMAIDDLRAADRAGRIRLHLHLSSASGRLTSESLGAVFGANGLRGAHVVICGPDAYARSVRKWARSLGARDIERESFDLRGGFGRDLSTTTILRRSPTWLRRLIAR